MMRSLLILAALLGLSTPALAQTGPLPQGEIRANGDITFGNALRLGKREDNKTVITPDTLQILGSGSTGDVSAMTVLPDAGAPQNSISSLLANRLLTRGNDITANVDESIADKVPFSNTGAKHFLYSHRSKTGRALLGTTSIIRNSVGSGDFGPGSADYALLTSSRKDDYLKSTAEGEIDTQIIIARQGKKGDSTPLALDTEKVRAKLDEVAPDETGATLGFEIAASLVRPGTGEPYHSSSVYGAFIESPFGPSKGAGFGFAARARRGNWYSAFYSAADQTLGGGGWDNIFVNDRTSAGDQSGINFRINESGRTFQGLPAGRMSWGYDDSSNAWTMRDETAKAERASILRDGGGLTLTGRYTALTMVDPVTGEATGGTHRLAMAGNGSAYYQVVGVDTAFRVDANASFITNNLQAAKVTVTQYLKLPAYTVATMPACNSVSLDWIIVVSDARTPTYRGALTGGGAVRTPAYCDGTSWTAH